MPKIEDWCLPGNGAETSITINYWIFAIVVYKHSLLIGPCIKRDFLISLETTPQIQQKLAYFPSHPYSTLVNFRQLNLFE